MDVREKLVEILKQAPFEGKVLDEWWFEEKIERIVDHLISQGVTVQEWISVEDKLPPYNRDVLVYRPDMAMKILVDNYDGYYGEDDAEWYEGWAKYGNDIHGKPIITHWEYLPQPPKGECTASFCEYRRKKQTNADRIRAMSDEELVGFLMRLMGHEQCFAEGIFPYHPCPQSHSCKQCGIDWLQQPAEEERK